MAYQSQISWPTDTSPELLAKLSSRASQENNISRTIGELIYATGDQLQLDFTTRGLRERAAEAAGYAWVGNSILQAHETGSVSSYRGFTAYVQDPYVQWLNELTREQRIMMEGKLAQNPSANRDGKRSYDDYREELDAGIWALVELMDTDPTGYAVLEVLKKQALDEIAGDGGFSLRIRLEIQGDPFAAGSGPLEQGYLGLDAGIKRYEQLHELLQAGVTRT